MNAYVLSVATQRFRSARGSAEECNQGGQSGKTWQPDQG